MKRKGTPDVNYTEPEALKALEQITLDTAVARDVLGTMFARRNLVPIIGSGFTKGSPTQFGRVPDGPEFKKIMLKSLEQHVGGDASALAEKRFSEIAEYFMNPDFVPRGVSKDIIRRYFVGVKLPAGQQAFLRCPWPYIYTLNVDDGIETHSEFRIKVLPNRPLSESSRTMARVYKVHGDAAEELLYDEPSKIIFSTGAYVRSLTTNQPMLNALRTDIIEQNTIYVGCGLADEIDLVFALAEYQGDFPKGRRSIYVCLHAPNKFEQAKLASHGIDTLLVISDYDSFYRTMAQFGQDSSRVNAPIYGIAQPHVSRLPADPQANRAFMLRDADANKTLKTLLLPFYHIRREIEDRVLAAADVQSICLIQGRRFSGRTLLLTSLAESARARNVRFIPSDTRASQEAIEELLNLRNALLLFDSNSLSPETAAYLAGASGRLTELGSSAVVAVNSTEPDVLGVMQKVVNDDAYFYLDARLSRRECSELNQRLDRLGLLRFDRRRTLLDNTFAMLQKWPELRTQLHSRNMLTSEEVELLLVVAVADKAYSALGTALDLRTRDLYLLCEKTGPVLDIAETSRGELREMHSKYKVIVNSRVGLAIQLRNVTEVMGHRWISERFATVVRRCLRLPEFNALGRSMYMFDAVNQALTPAAAAEDKTGFRPVIRSLYEELQEDLSHSPDYWLQRSKAVLNVEDSEDRIIEGIQWAKKCFEEADREKTRVNAGFHISLLCGKLCSVTRFAKTGYVLEAVRYFYHAIRDYHRNAKHVLELIESSRRRKSWFDELCDYLEGERLPFELLTVKREVDFLLSVRRVWRDDAATSKATSTSSPR
jgi:hypothetical protein